MIEVRTATQSDREAIRDLWRICFGDSEAFMDWFFAERFFPEYSACLCEDGALVTALQSYPLHARIRDTILPVSMLAGVSTNPAYGGRGYMKLAFSHYMQLVRAQGIPIAIHTPAHAETFLSRGHYPVTDTLYLTYASAPAATLPANIRAQDLHCGLGLMQTCYQQATAGYSGCISRTMADFAYKLRDYAADGGKCLLYERDSHVQGYCIYYALPEHVHAEECVAMDEQTLSLLIQALCHEAAGRKLTMKLPPDAKHVAPRAELIRKPQGSMGIADISAVLRLLLNDSAFVFEIRDPVLPQNVGVWDGTGRAVRCTPQFAVEAGRLGQALCGYRSVQELILSGDLHAHTGAPVKALCAALPPQTCFIIDEY